MEGFIRMWKVLFVIRKGLLGLGRTYWDWRALSWIRRSLSILKNFISKGRKTVKSNKGWQSGYQFTSIPIIFFILNEMFDIE